MSRLRTVIYLVRVFKKERPNRSILKFLFKTIQYTTDELYRIATAIDRFGLDNLI